ncbi:MAG: galactokinase [Candidatus Hydrogenedentota bacterium]|nr:MAG: galactokinase [Candidatus Hydrogenedentota bacterium]
MTELTDITAVILAGGMGTRLQDVVDDRSKVMAEVAGRPFVTYLLDQLEEVGVRRVVICTGHHANHLENKLGDKYGEMELVYSRENEPMGTGGALRMALPLLESDPVLVLNGDSYCSVNLAHCFEAHARYNGAGVLCLCEKPDTASYGSVDLGDDSEIVGFREKDATSGPGWINAGVYLLNRELIESIPSDRAVSLEREIFPDWTGRGLFGYRSDCELLDIGTPERYEQAETFFASLASARKKGSVA